ncbi:glutamate--tRNA ligase [Synoicihabitans lomoniglobus]|uniref:Glutamate--tRNA ligase n=1 Tax=Synoicihabitans lomoniglobus TaxID=2909285 RepID=A0AAF0CS65_9BACT|nr:glutamate--tRNA ligase [Opitutaceae bacterium LMO-M01]WED67011.1 glutamate--tRNA ligase family protein [Opitutaceae bacterium LMO-M01]
MSQVRVRFAPSPTGFFHIGSARTALFNWLYARHTGGVFVLRVEDTDKERNSEAFLNVIYDSMRWLGLNWDEGPQAGGDCGPYRQSERAPIYTEYLEKLRATGRVYEKEGATWFKISGEPQIIEDAIRGRVERTEEKDFVIIRSDGNPVFHFVNVVDDITMGITHVIRGEDHLSNTSKHTELFKAFGAPLPVFAHIPLILKQDGPGKMSKRDQGALIEEYQKRGYLPEAVVNFLCLLGWNPKDDSEKLPIAEIIERFDFPGINQSNARFDDRKMAHMNMTYLLELPAADYLALARRHFAADPAHAATMASVTPEYFADVIAISQPKVKAIDELPDYTAYFFREEFPWNDKAVKKTFKKGEPLARLAELREMLAAGPDFADETAVEETIKAAAEAQGFGFGDYQAVARLATTGTNAGPGLTQIFRVLGKAKVLARFDRFLANPPAVS